MWGRRDAAVERFAGQYPGDETECHFVSTFGLMKTCPVRSLARPGKPSVRPRGMARAHRETGAIYVHPELLAGFARWVLPRLRAPFTLLTGNSVLDIGPGPVPRRVIEAITGHPQFRHWFAQNLAMARPGLSVLPLGLDYHTMSVGRVAWWGDLATPTEQESALDRLRLAAPPLAERVAKGYSNWQFAPDNSARASVRQVLSPEVNVYQEARMPRAESWAANSRHFFTMSPRGRGMDCHRTWEAILIGAVPVIDELPIAPVYHDLPVVTVRDWVQVTPAFLAAERARILAGSFDFAPMFLTYWRRKIAGAPLPSLRMPYQAFLTTPAATLAARMV